MSSRLVGPADAPFRQQRLPAWQPILSPPYVISCFLLIAGVFIPIGAVIISASARVVEVVVEYDKEPPYDYSTLAPEYANSNLSCADILADQSRNNRTPICVSKLQLVTTVTVDAPVYMYYRLTNFYQNHRRFASSRFDNQLAGRAVTTKEVKDTCQTPFATFMDNGTEIILNPCGLVAWSMFNDSFQLMRGSTVLCDTRRPSNRICNDALETDTANVSNVSTVYYRALCNRYPQSYCRKDDIAWKSDRTKKFQQDEEYQRDPAYLSFPYSYPNTTPPGGEGHMIPDVNDEDLMVWMRTAAMPTFRKLMRVISEPLEKGTEYELTAYQRYSVQTFGGTKALVFANNMWIGGRNEFLGGAYIVVGSVCALLAGLFLIKHVLRPRTPADLSFFQQGARPPGS